MEEYDKKTHRDQGNNSSRSNDDIIPANIDRQREIFGRSKTGPDVPEYEYGRHAARQSRDHMDTRLSMTFKYWEQVCELDAIPKMALI